MLLLHLAQQNPRNRTRTILMKKRRRSTSPENQPQSRVARGDEAIVNNLSDIDLPRAAAEVGVEEVLVDRASMIRSVDQLQLPHRSFSRNLVAHLLDAPLSSHRGEVEDLITESSKAW